MTSKDVKHLYLTLPIILIINTLFKRFRQMIKEIWLITLKNLFLYPPGQQSAGGILGNVEHRRHVFNHIVGRVIFHDIIYCIIQRFLHPLCLCSQWMAAHPAVLVAWTIQGTAYWAVLRKV